MKSKLNVLLLLLIISASALALPSYTGLRGLNRTVDAKPIGAGEFSVALFSFLGFSDDARLAQLSSGAEEVTDTEYDGTWYITTAFGLGDKFEVAGRFSYVWNCLSRESVPGRENLAGGENDNDDGFSEASLFLKYGISPGDGGNFWVGVMPWVGFKIYDGGNSPFVLNNNQYDGIWQPGQPMFQMRRPMIGSEFSGGADLLLSMDLDPVVMHSNIGYHYFKQSFQFTDYRYGTNDSVDVDMDVEDPVFHLALGFEYPMNGWTLFAEAEWRHFMKRDYEDGDEEDYDDMIIIQPGVRFEVGSGFACDVVGGFSLDNFDPEWSDMGHHAYQAGGNPSEDYRANFAPFPEGYYPTWGIGVNLMYSSDLVEGPSTAIMSGTVTDALTGEFLQAEVSFPGTAVASVMTDAGTGFYSVEVPEGAMAVAVNASGYMEKTEAIEVAAGQNFGRDYALDPMKNVTGTITDDETGMPIEGTVTLDSGESVNAASNGFYAISVNSGHETLTASANGYIPMCKDVSISRSEDAVVDFQLEAMETGDVLSFDNIYFDFNSSTIKAESYSILDGVVAILSTNPNALIQIAGHTDSDGDANYNQTLSEQRAMSVYNYLVQNGISADRLSTIGYGETQPVVPNTSSANKAKNRRIEFLVLSNR